MVIARKDSREELLLNVEMISGGQVTFNYRSDDLPFMMSYGEEIRNITRMDFADVAPATIILDEDYHPALVGAMFP